MDACRAVPREDLVLWCIMGLYPSRRCASYVIHDYRSLSVEPFAAVKDGLKRFVNAQPDLRIFQNSAIEEVLGFCDGAPSVHLPMGLPEWIGEIEKQPKLYDFGYLGAVNKDRGFDQIFESFLGRYDGRRTMLIIGPCEDAILRRWGGEAALTFMGALPQREALGKITAARVALALFPNHRPHCWQTPTKLLEYAALRLPIIANESAMVRTVAESLSVPIKFVGEQLFGDLEFGDELWGERFEGDLSALYWPSVIADSRVEHAICNDAQR